jgi:hypothetical protein
LPCARRLRRVSRAASPDDDSTKCNSEQLRKIIQEVKCSNQMNDYDH